MLSRQCLSQTAHIVRSKDACKMACEITRWIQSTPDNNMLSMTCFHLWEHHTLPYTAHLNTYGSLDHV